MTKHPVLKEVAPGTAMLALAVLGYLQAGTMQADGAAAGLGPDLWPKMICLLLGVTSVFGIAGGLLQGSGRVAAEPDGDEEGLPSMPETQPWMVWVAVLVTGAFVAVLPTLGFVTAASLYAMALLVIGGMRRWPLVPVYGVVLAIAFTAIFMKVVYVALPLGEGWFKTVSLNVFRLLGIH